MNIKNLVGQRVVQAHVIGSDVVTLKMEDGAVYQLPATPWVSSPEFDEVTTYVNVTSGFVKDLWGADIQGIELHHESEEGVNLTLRTDKGICSITLYSSLNFAKDLIMKVGTGPAPEVIEHHIVQDGEIKNCDIPEPTVAKYYGPDRLCLKCGRAKAGGHCLVCNFCLSKKANIYLFSRISAESEKLITHNGKVLWVACKEAQPYSTPIPEGMVVVNYTTWPGRCKSILTWNRWDYKSEKIIQEVQSFAAFLDGPLHRTDEDMDFFLKKAMEETMWLKRIDKSEPRPVSFFAEAAYVLASNTLPDEEIGKAVSQILQENPGKWLYLLETPGKKYLFSNKVKTFAESMISPKKHPNWPAGLGLIESNKVITIPRGSDSEKELQMIEDIRRAIDNL